MSLPISHVVNPAETTTVLRSTRTPQVVGQPSTFWTAVQALPPSKATPTGTVDFFAHGYGYKCWRTKWVKSYYGWRQVRVNVCY